MCPFEVDFERVQARNPELRVQGVQVRPEQDYLQRELGLMQRGVSKNRGTPKWMVCNGKPY